MMRLAALPDHEECRTRPVLPAQHSIAHKGTCIEVAVAEGVVRSTVTIEVDMLLTIQVTDSRARNTPLRSGAHARTKFQKIIGFRSSKLLVLHIVTR